MENEDLKAYLEAYRSEGVFDSEGFFTLDRQKAVGKLARYQLADDGSWALKVLQGATRLRSKSVYIEELGAYSHIQVSTGIDTKGTHIRRALTGESSGVFGIDTIGEALRSVSGRMVTVQLRHGKTITTFVVTNNQISESEATAELEENRLDIVVQREKEIQPDLFERSKDAALRFTGKYVARVRSVEHDILARRARVAEIPLWLNGRRIDDLNIPWDLGSVITIFAGVIHAKSRNAEENNIMVPNGVARSRGDGMLPGNHGPLAYLRYLPNTKVQCLLTTGRLLGRRASAEALKMALRHPPFDRPEVNQS